MVLKHSAGCEWVVEAHGCDPAALTDETKLRDLFARLVEAFDLHPVEQTMWHQFAGAGGITGLCLLAESHLACHTFPEFGSLCLNVFCCRPRSDWAFDAHLTELFSASSIAIRRLDRPYA